MKNSFKKLTLMSATQMPTNLLYSTKITTPLGVMLAIGDEQALHFLQFVDVHNLDKLVQQLTNNVVMSSKKTAPLILCEQELNAYFAGTLTTFTTPLQFTGSTFQKSAWKKLLEVPYGTTKSYSDQAHAVGSPSAHRAVANANGANKIAIIVPCHRIIAKDNSLGGYNGGISRKQWLLDHEVKNCRP